MTSSLWKAALAEAVGTFTLIFIGAGSIIADQLSGGRVGLVGVALAHGLAIGTMVSATGHLSGGHLNPAVTTGLRWPPERWPVAETMVPMARPWASATPTRPTRPPLSWSAMIDPAPMKMSVNVPTASASAAFQRDDVI